MTLSVNGEKIDDSVILQEAEQMKPHYEEMFSEQNPEQQQEQLIEWSTENVIEKVLIKQQAEKSDEQIPVEEIDSAFEEIKKQYGDQELTGEVEKKMREDIERQIKIQHLLAEVCKDVDGPSDKEILSYYDENKERFMTAEQVRVAHIIKHVNWQADEKAAYEEIQKAEDELKAGSLFEMLVEKYSDCPDNGGDLGYISRGQMVEEFEDVAFNLKPNQVSDIFRSRFGFHLVKLYDRKAAVTAKLAEVKSEIAAQLQEQTNREAVEKFVDKLKVEAKIEQV